MRPLWSRSVGPSDKAFPGWRWPENRTGIMRPGGGAVRQPRRKEQGPCQSQGNPAEGPGGEEASAAGVGGGRGEASPRRAGDSGGAAQLIIPAPELGGRIDHSRGPPGVPHYAAGPGMCSAVAVTKEPGNASLPIDTQVGAPPSPSSNYLAGLFTGKAQKRTPTIKRPRRFALDKAVEEAGAGWMPETAGWGRPGTSLCLLVLLHSRHPTWAQTARFSQGFQALQELGRADQPPLSPKTPAPGQLASTAFQEHRPRTQRVNDFRSFYSTVSS